MRAVTTALPQKSARQSANSMTAAATGRPTAPPMPSVALTVAMAEESRSRGTPSRSSAIARGTMPMPRPCSARPAIMISTVGASAQTTAPRMSGNVLMRIMRFLPKRSPRRPAIGTATAAASSVAVTIQAVFAEEVSKMPGSSAMSGVIIVWVIEAAMPAKASTPMSSPGRAVGVAVTVLLGSAAVMHSTQSMHDAYPG